MGGRVDFQPAEAQELVLAGLRALAGAAEDAIAAMPRAIGEGWAMVSVMLLRSRIAREGEGQWKSVSEFRVRMLRSEL